MAYLQLDLPMSLPPELRDRSATEAAALDAEVMETDVDRVGVAFRELGPTASCAPAGRVCIHFTQHHPDEISRDGGFTEAWRSGLGALADDQGDGGWPVTWWPAADRGARPHPRRPR